MYLLVDSVLVQCLFFCTKQNSGCICVMKISNGTITVLSENFVQRYNVQQPYDDQLTSDSLADLCHLTNQELDFETTVIRFQHWPC